MRGRNIFVVSLDRILRGADIETLADRARNARLSAVWIRAGRGEGVDANMSHPAFAPLRDTLRSMGLGVWGWHVPFCADASAARREAALVLDWVETNALDGMVLDAERTPENPRFQGDAAEAALYAGAVAEGLRKRGKGVALSSHDQPRLHRELPWRAFLERIENVCPQVYYRARDVEARFRRSQRDYRELIGDHAMAARYKPTGNISVSDDVSHASVVACLDAAATFLALVREGGYEACSFWCWDTAPEEIWDFLARAEE
jgi:hypothetical protein